MSRKYLVFSPCTNLLLIRKYFVIEFHMTCMDIQSNVLFNLAFMVNDSLKHQISLVYCHIYKIMQKGYNSGIFSAKVYIKIYYTLLFFLFLLLRHIIDQFLSAVLHLAFVFHNFFNFSNFYLKNTYKDQYVKLLLLSRHMINRSEHAIYFLYRMYYQTSVNINHRDLGSWSDMKKSCNNLILSYFFIQRVKLQYDNIRLLHHNIFHNRCFFSSRAGGSMVDHDRGVILHQI